LEKEIGKKEATQKWLNEWLPVPNRKGKLLNRGFSDSLFIL
jgi:hypothetical protein